MNIKNTITIDPEIVSGTPVFYGTRVPIEFLFGHLQSGDTIDQFLNSFPTVNKKQVDSLLKLLFESVLLDTKKNENITRRKHTKRNKARISRV